MANAAQLEEMYGATLREEQYNKLSIRKLSQALLEFNPPVHATDQVCKTWISKYRIFGDCVRIDSVEALEAQYGEAIRACPREQRKTPYVLCNHALRNMQPQKVIVDNAIAFGWLKKYDSSYVTLKHVQNAGHLETWYGARIRDQDPERSMGAEELSS